ncbi:hypothetical protein SLEP1_g37745 [Rubroshorea leprosula]|uniref:Uncharacterized protein n=1 Tax=Rubroshorea leprosula TaxID=152421 RepID=A0AAV5KVL6_9ROSI|nr:hypothetical protein SLEP1_g37745 [Rubroshorea leprosula]
MGGEKKMIRRQLDSRRPNSTPDFVGLLHSGRSLLCDLGFEHPLAASIFFTTAFRGVS